MVGNTYWISGYQLHKSVFKTIFYNNTAICATAPITTKWHNKYTNLPVLMYQQMHNLKKRDHKSNIIVTCLLLSPKSPWSSFLLQTEHMQNRQNFSKSNTFSGFLKPESDLDSASVLWLEDTFNTQPMNGWCQSAQIRHRPHWIHHSWIIPRDRTPCLSFILYQYATFGTKGVKTLSQESTNKWKLSESFVIYNTGYSVRRLVQLFESLLMKHV